MRAGVARLYSQFAGGLMDGLDEQSGRTVWIDASTVYLPSRAPGCPLECRSTCCALCMDNVGNKVNKST